MSDILTETTCPLEMLGEDDDNRCRMGRDSTENSNSAKEETQSNTNHNDNVNSYANESSLGTSDRSNVMVEFSLKVEKQGISTRIEGTGLDLISLLEYSYVKDESVRKILKFWIENSPALNGGEDGNK